jgi:hypothetical protein
VVNCIARTWRLKLGVRYIWNRTKYDRVYCWFCCLCFCMHMHVHSSRFHQYSANKQLPFKLHAEFVMNVSLSRASRSFHLVVVLVSCCCRCRVCWLLSSYISVWKTAALDRHCRFHELVEFDDTKRSCRRRLAGHNERRRKSSSDANGGDGCRHADQDGRGHPGNPPLNHFQIR